MTHKRISLTLPPEIVGLLARVGNRSHYCARVLSERWRDWQEALALLRTLGWTNADLLSACDRLNSHYVYAGLGLADDLSLAIERPLTEPEALALWTVTREFWAGNAEARKALTGEPR